MKIVSREMNERSLVREYRDPDPYNRWGENGLPEWISLHQ